MKKAFLTALMALALSTSAFSAYDFSSGGVYYSKLSENTCAVSFLYRGGYSGSITIPETVEYDQEYTVVAIGTDAFNNCSRLTSVTLPSTITSIGDNAFNYCSGLTKLDIPSSVETIGANAFYGCSGVADFNLPEGLKSLGNGAFSNCTKITSITLPEAITSIGESTFYGCTSLESVSMSDNVTSIGRYAFNYCSKLKTFTLPSALTSVDSYAFNSCKGLESLTIPAGVTNLGTMAFFNCNGVTELTFEDSENPITIGDNAFNGVGCTDAYIGRNLDTAVLSGNGKVKNLEIGGFCTSVAADAFKGCTELEEVVFGKSVTSVGAGAFDECTKIAKIQSDNTVPPTMECTFAPEVYADCVLYVPAESKDAYSTANVWKEFTNVTLMGEVITGVAQIETSAAHAEYYTLQGVRVSAPTAAGIYIVKSGDKTYKVAIK